MASVAIVGPAGNLQFSLDISGSGSDNDDVVQECRVPVP